MRASGDAFAVAPEHENDGDVHHEYHERGPAHAPYELGHFERQVERGAHDAEAPRPVPAVPEPVRFDEADPGVEERPDAERNTVRVAEVDERIEKDLRMMARGIQFEVAHEVFGHA